MLLAQFYLKKTAYATAAIKKYRGDKLNGKIKIDIGMEKLAMEFTLRACSSEVYNQWWSLRYSRCGSAFVRQ